MSSRWNWDSPTPLAASEYALPPGPKGGGAHSPAAKGVGESQFQRLEKRLALCLLCAGQVSFSAENSAFCRKSRIFIQKDAFPVYLHSNWIRTAVRAEKG